MDKVTVKDLRKQAKDLGIKNYTGFRKAELFELVQNTSRDTTVVEPKKGRPVVDEPPQKTLRRLVPVPAPRNSRPPMNNLTPKPPKPHLPL